MSLINDVLRNIEAKRPDDLARHKLQREIRALPAGRSGFGRAAWLVGGLAAILASTCCLGPLILVMLGISGAWIGNLAVLEPYRPFFIGVALIALAFAWRRIYRPATVCVPGEVCAVPQVRRIYRWIFWISRGVGIHFNSGRQRQTAVGEFCHSGFNLLEAMKNLLHYNASNRIKSILIVKNRQITRFGLKELPEWE